MGYSTVWQGHPSHSYAVLVLLSTLLWMQPKIYLMQLCGLRNQAHLDEKSKLCRTALVSAQHHQHSQTDANQRQNLKAL